MRLVLPDRIALSCGTSDAEFRIAGMFIPFYGEPSSVPGGDKCRAAGEQPWLMGGDNSPFDWQKFVT
jgi:hypothetical protein